MAQFNVSNNLYQFPFNVLVVDDDLTHLSAVVDALLTFGYEVVPLQNADHAAAILKRKKRFDIVVCGISISKVEAFNLLRTAEELHIPVIFPNFSDEAAFEGVASQGLLSGAGAAQCVAKLPILHIQALKNIWQHAVSKRKNHDFECVYLHPNEPSSKVSSLKFAGDNVSPTTYGGGPSCSNPITFRETRSSFDSSSNPITFRETRRSPTGSSNPITFRETRSRSSVPTIAYGGGPNCSNPKPNLKISEERSEGFDHDLQDMFKKERFVWIDEYHQLFLDAIKDIALKDEKIVPKRIFNYMKSKGVTHINRENIASHLQKHRYNTKKLNSNGFDKSSNFPNSDVTIKELNLGKSCSSDDQTLSKTQNLASQDLITKQEQETPPTTQPLNQILFYDQTMQDIIDWNTLEGIQPGFENSTNQPQQVGQENNINFALDFSHIRNEELDPSIVLANPIDGNIIGPDDHPQMTGFNQNLENGLLNEYVYNSQNFENFESFENLDEDGFQALRGVEMLNSNKHVVIK